MSAHEQMRQMLDQLMGTGRDGENNRYKVHFTDPRVCKSFLLACCPHDILQSTRMDLGDCPKIHDLALRADYEAANLKKDYFYDVDAMEHLQNFINDCDRRTEQAKKRLAETQEELSSEVTLKLNKVHELAEQIGKKLAQAENLGADGNVEESLKLMEEVEEIRKTKAQAEQDYRNSMPASSYQQQKLRVCEVCSAYLGIHDNDRRLADHFGGKLHLGFITIREKLDELKSGVTERREKGRIERDKEFERERMERIPERGRSQNNWNNTTRERSRSRGRVRQSYNWSSDARASLENEIQSCSPGRDYLPQRSRSRSRSGSRRHSPSPSSHSGTGSRHSSHSSRDRHRHREDKESRRSHRHGYEHHRSSREHRHSRQSRDRSP